MVESEQADGAGGRLYAYRVRGAGRSGVVLWVGGRGDDLDRVVSVGEGGRRRVPVFVTGRQARVFAGRRGWRLAASEVGALELVRVERWLADPVRRRVPAGVVLEAWNFFEDLARGLGEGHRLLRQGAVHDGAYEKLFAGECDEWTPDERCAVRELLTAGVELWESAS
ncbi:hypothetical protein [Streptomyces murinus]|uniref:Uncharacterized protein n=1 Tax=Streptomyces murinus TaxID=33900 RepID=A0A7W3NNK4_STRMR|nr:hypothetical protein [Streptomyces murinus]MBA9053783.1 hypothetical protein [Streptomyces murinus]